MGHFWFTPRLAFVHSATSLPKVAHSCFVIFGPHSPFPTWATLGWHPDYTLQEHRIFAKKGPHLLWDMWTIFAILQVGHFRHTSIWSGPEEGQQCRIIAWSGPHPLAIWDWINHWINLQPGFSRFNAIEPGTWEGGVLRGLQYPHVGGEL